MEPDESFNPANSEIRDPSSLFWRRMKAQHDSSDSGEKPSESSTELCRISIKCSVPEQSSSSTSQEKPLKPKSDSESPPIIIEELIPTERLSDDESVKSEGNNSQKSVDGTLDTSLNKPLSPTSSVTSQRKLEWDSLADVGYANEGDRKTSGSSLSTLERLALMQQYTNSDNKHNSDLGQPSAHSTLLDINKESKETDKKNLVKKTREIHQRDIDTVEVHVPQTSGNMPISVNLTKRISFNVEKGGGIIVENNEKEITVHPEKRVSVQTIMSPEVRFDKEIQTSFTKSVTETSESSNKKRNVQSHEMESGPVFISLHTLRNRIKRRKRRPSRKKPVSKMYTKAKGQDRHLNKGTEQVSEAESFEYMPGHIYNQNQMKDGDQKTRTSAGNKSSLESSGGITTESSKSYSFTKELEKSIKLLNEVLQRHNDDSHLKKKLVKDVVRKLVKSNYRDDESGTEILSGLSFNSKRLDLSNVSQNYSTTSTSDVNNSGDTAQRPKKSILRMEKFDSKTLSTNSQSAPNLPTVSTSDMPTVTKLGPFINLESDASGEKSFIKTSSEEIYQKYLEALRKEEAYRKHLKDKGKFLKQKLVGSDSASRAPEIPVSVAKPNKLKDLIKDLIRNNYDDGSGDASKLEGGPSSNSRNFTSNSDTRKQRKHSVFTLSSGNSDRKCLDRESRKINLRKRLEDEIQAGSSSNEGTSKAGLRREHYCCCPHHSARYGFTDSATQVNIVHCQSCEKRKMVPTNSFPCKMAEEMGVVKLSCSEKPVSPRKYDAECTINKTSDLDTHKEFDNYSFNATAQCSGSRKTTPLSSPRVASSKGRDASTSHPVEFMNVHPHRALRASDEVIFEKWGELTKKMSQSSQTNVAINIFTQKLNNNICDCNNPTCTQRCNVAKSFTSTNLAQALSNASETVMVHETTRCLQTEISIDPKISDPQLHDIVIVNSQDLVQVISDHCRPVLKSKFSEASNMELKYLKKFKNSETQFGTDTDMYTYFSPRIGVTDKSLTYCRTQTFEPDNKQDAASQSNIDSGEQLGFHLPSEFKINSDSYAIPLEGTNMTLRVSIGSKDAKNQNVEQKTKKPLHHSPIENFAPRVKCNSNPFGDLSDRSSCKASSPSAKVEKTAMTEDCCECTKKQHHTYPSVQKKTFLRTNTDTSLLQNQAIGDTIERKPVKGLEKKIRDVDTQANLPTEEKSIETFKSSVASKAASQKTNFPECQNTVQKATVDVGSNSNVCLNNLVKNIEKSDEATACSYRKEPIKTLCEVPKVPDEKRNCTDYAKPKQMDTSAKCQSCEARTENKNDKPNSETSRLCQTETSSTKLHEADSVDAALIEASEKANCNSCSKPLKKMPGIPLKFISCMCLDKEPDKSKTNLCEANPEAVTSAGTQPTSARSTCSDPVMEKIQEITKRYGKKDLDKTKRKKCFNEIISVLNYLLETEDKPDFTKQDYIGTTSNETSDESASCSKATQESNQPVDKLPSKCTNKSGTTRSPKKFIDKAIQLTQRKSRNKLSSSGSSDIPTSSDIQECTTDAATCKILKKIKKECEKYHHKRCKSLYHSAKCETSSTSAQCVHCKKAPHCVCRTPKCKSKTTSPLQRLKKKCVAYNLILQTSESIGSDSLDKERENKRELENVVVKVPPKRCKPLPEYQSYLPHKYEQTQTRTRRPRSANEQFSATDDYKKAHGLTVKEYLEKNRPDFIESSAQRQSCLKMMEEHRANERKLRRRLLSVQLERQSALSGVSVSASQLRRLAREIGLDTRRAASFPKFTSEREMKKHSEKIFRKLPEQVRKKEEQRYENIKRTNLLMASIFKKNLQKKTLRGSVNLSNYNTVIKI